MYCQANDTGTSASTEQWHSHAGAEFIRSPRSRMTEREGATGMCLSSNLTLNDLAAYN
jgi:hypothetical protein